MTDPIAPEGMEKPVNPSEPSAPVAVPPAATRILWAVDPFEKDPSAVRSAARCLRSLAKAGPTEIEPVCMWSSPLMEYSIASEGKAFAEVQRRGQSALMAAIANVTPPGLRPLRILPHWMFSNRDRVHVLLEHAHARGCDLIMVASHGRRGLRRLVMGSFAETLALCSDIPFVSVHPEQRRAPELRTIVFPTDFSLESRRAFAKAVIFARAQGARIVLFHKAVEVVYPMNNLDLMAYELFESQLKQDAALREKIAERMAKRARLHGVPAEVVFDHSHRGSVGAAILKCARKYHGVVAMASHSGAVSAAFLGSATRAVLRAASTPVWVIHPRARKASKPKHREARIPGVDERDLNHDLIQHGRPKAA